MKKIWLNHQAEIVCRREEVIAKSSVSKVKPVNSMSEQSVVDLIKMRRSRK